MWPYRHKLAINESLNSLFNLSTFCLFSMLLSNSSLPTPHREDNKLVDKISGWPSAGATSNRPQTTLATTNIPRFYQRPISGNTPLPKKKSLEEPKSYRYSGALQLSSYSEMPNSRNLDYLATKRKYSATTQSAWDEIDWNKKLISKFPNTVQPHKQSVPDPVANSNRIPRYYPSSFNWQRLGNSWDYFQPRNIPEKRVSEFISPYKENLKVSNVSFCVCVWNFGMTIELIGASLFRGMDRIRPVLW